MKENLLIFGAGTYAHTAREIAKEMDCFGKIEIFPVNDVHILTKNPSYEQHVGMYRYAFAAIDCPEQRLALIHRLEAACFQIAILASPRAYIAPDARLMKGTMIGPKAAVHTEATASIGCIISDGAVLCRESFIGDGCHIDQETVISDYTVVPACTHVPAGSRFSLKADIDVCSHSQNPRFETGL